MNKTMFVHCSKSFQNPETYFLQICQASSSFFYCESQFIRVVAIMQISGYPLVKISRITLFKYSNNTIFQVIYSLKQKILTIIRTAY